MKHGRASRPAGSTVKNKSTGRDSGVGFAVPEKLRTGLPSSGCGLRPPSIGWGLPSPRVDPERGPAAGPPWGPPRAPQTFNAAGRDDGHWRLGAGHFLNEATFQNRYLTLPKLQNKVSASFGASLRNAPGARPLRCWFVSLFWDLPFLGLLRFHARTMAP